MHRARSKRPIINHLETTGDTSTTIINNVIQPQRHAGTLHYDPKQKSTKNRQFFKCCYIIIFVCLSIMLLAIISYHNDGHLISFRGSSSANINMNINTIINPKATIAYAVSLTGCGGDQFLADGAAVLKHSIHLSSIHNPSSSSTSKYSYKLFAIVHPQAMQCVDAFLKLGYEVLERDTPIDVTKIKGKYLRDSIVKTGCCQEKELIKLWAYTLLDYPVVVHLDLDTLVLQPMDELFDAMIDGPHDEENIPIMFNAKFPKKVDAFFTRDYNLLYSVRKHVGVQGGFFVVRPSQEAFKTYQQTIIEGNYKHGGGWGGLGFGGFYGAQQIQGLLPYFYDHLHNGTTSLELNRCYYNSMVDFPRFNFVKKKTHATDAATTTQQKGLCKDTGTYECDNCQETNITNIKSVHFTICQKPWLCRWNRIGIDGSEARLCNDIIQKWFRIRRDVENLWAKQSSSKNKFISNGNGTHRVDQFSGFCTRGGIKGYKKLTTIPSFLS